MQHKRACSLVVIGNDAVQYGILDSAFQRAHLPAGRQIECFHNLLTADRRLEVTDAVALLQVLQLLAHQLEVVQEALLTLHVLGSDIGLAQGHKVVYVIARLKQKARQIGTEDFARTMPEYCGVISKSPTVKAVKSKIEAEEEKFDFSILDKVVEEANNVDIREIAQQTEQEVVEVETVNGFGPNDVILDIRSIDEQEDKPLKVEGIDVVSLPFYKLSTKFGDLDQNKTWLLWCERGVMSRLQALYLREQGFNNVKVYRP